MAQQPNTARAGFLRRVADFTVGYDVFISYRQKEAKPYAVKLAERLRGRRLRVFLDTTDAQPGRDLAAFPKAAGASRTLALVVTPGVYESDSVLQELRGYFLRRMDRRRKRMFSRVVPINVDGALNDAPGEPNDWRRLKDYLFVKESRAAVDAAEPSADVVDELARSSVFLRSTVLFSTILLVATSALVTAAFVAALQLLDFRSRVASLQETEQAQNRSIAIQSVWQELQHSVIGGLGRLRDVLQTQVAKKDGEIRGKEVMLGALSARAEEQKAIADRENRKARVALLAQESDMAAGRDPTQSFRAAERAFALDRDSLIAYGALLRAYYRPGRFYSVLDRRDSVARCLSASADGSLAAAAFSDGAVVIWNGEGGVVAEWRHTGEAESVAFTKDNGVLSAGYDGTLHLWRPDGGETVIDRGHPLRAVAPLPDGKLVVVGNRSIELLDPAQAAQPLWSAPLPRGPLAVAVDSADGRWAAVSVRSDDGAVRVPYDREGRSQVLLYDLVKRELARSLELEGMVVSMGFSQQKLAAGSWSGALSLIDPATGTLRELRRQLYAITAISVRARSNMVLAALHGGSVESVTFDGLEGDTYAGHAFAVNAVAASENTAAVITATGGTVLRWETGQRTSGRLLAGNVPVVDVLVDPARTRALVQFADNRLVLTDLSSGRETELNPVNPLGQNWLALQASFNPSGSVIAVAQEGKLKLWDTRSGKQRAVPVAEGLDTFQWPAFHSDSSLTALARGGTRLMRLDLDSGIAEDRAEVPPGAVRVAYAGGSADRFIALACPAAACTLSAHDGATTLRRVDNLAKQDPIALSPDGRTMAWAEGRRAIRLAGIDGGAPERVAEGSVSTTELSFSPDGRMLMGADGSSLRLYDLAGRLLADIDTAGRVRGPFFTPTGSHVVLVDASNQLWFMPLDPDELIRYVHVEAPDEGQRRGGGIAVRSRAAGARTPTWAGVRRLR